MKKIYLKDRDVTLDVDPEKIESTLARLIDAGYDAIVIDESPIADEREFWYAKDPSERNTWVVFVRSNSVVSRVRSYRTPPKDEYKRGSWPAEYEGDPLTSMIRVK